jgi:hypothetical protein
MQSDATPGSTLLQQYSAANGIDESKKNSKILFLRLPIKLMF